MEYDLTVDKSVHYLLQQEYFKEFQSIDGMSQHPAGRNFYEWLFDRQLISQQTKDRMNAQIEEERKREEAEEAKSGSFWTYCENCSKSLEHDDNFEYTSKEELEKAADAEEWTITPAGKTYCPECSYLHFVGRP